MEEPQQNMSRPVSRSSTSSATENDELVKRLEVQGQRKKELGLLIGQLHSMMDDEPVEQLKHKLKEMGIVQSENERLRGEISGYEDKVLQIEKRHFGALTGQGLVQIALKNYEKAIDSYIEAHKIHPYMKSPMIMIQKLQIELQKQAI